MVDLTLADTIALVRAHLTLDLAIFLLAAFLGAFVSGLSGFAFGLVASAIWLHAITPIQSAVLIAAFACVVQSMATWRMRHAVYPSRIAPFVVGGAVGIPIGAEILRFVSASTMRGILGVFILVFTAYFMLRPNLGKARSRPLIDGVVGIGGGIVGALTGLSGVVINIWTTMQGWPKDEQRAIFQPAATLLFIATLIWFGSAGIIPDGTWRLFWLGLPGVLIGNWIGLALYGRLDEAGFRRIVLWLLFLSGLSLLPSLFA